MSKRKHKMHWRNSDTEEITRLINNFNAKIYRVKKKNPKAVEYLPQHLHKKEVVSSIETRQDFNRLKESLERFNKRGMEKPVELPNKVTVTKWQKRELDDAVENYNKKRKYRLQRHKANEDYFPPERTVQGVERSVYSKEDAERLTQMYQGYEKPDAFEIVKTGKGHFAKQGIEHGKVEFEISEREKQKEREKILDSEVKLGGVGQKVSKRQHSEFMENELKPSSFNPDNMNNKEILAKFRVMDRMIDSSRKVERMEKMRENYLKGLADGGFLDAMLDLEEMIRSVPVDIFVLNAETDETATFLFYKDPQAWHVRAEYIYNTWGSLYNDYGVKENG